MKKLLIILSFLFIGTIAQAQEYKIVNGIMTEIKRAETTTDIKTKMTVTKKGITYVIWKSKRDKYYIIRTKAYQ